MGPLGGEGGLRLQTHNHSRTSSDPFDGPDSDDIADGRDLGRISVQAGWQNSYLLPNGVVTTVMGDLTADAYTITDDAVYAGNTTRTFANAGVELRWPLMKAGAKGSVQLIEPVAQAVWSSSDDAELPNEDSVLVEFDEGNLFSLNRFPGADAIEQGKRLNLGVIWTRYDSAGWLIGVTAGRTFREADLGQFGPGAGLQGRTSDWLAAINVDLAGTFALNARALIDDDLNLTLGEARMIYSGPQTAMAGSVIWAVPDITEDRPEATQEVTFDARQNIDPNWTAIASGRYDFVADRGSVAGLGVEYINECVRFDVSLSRRFTSSTSVTPTTDFTLSLDLIGFGGSGTGGPARTCRQ
jgi:LPS-assembly protein